MKTRKHFISILIVSMLFILCFSCNKEAKEYDSNEKIENTLKSVSLIYDSIQTEPSVLLSYLERFNIIIDSIGYPDAGYKLWIIQNDSTIDYKYLIEGYWPNQAIYDTIHNHVLYKDEYELQDNFWEGIKYIFYNRFTVIK